MSKYLLIAIFAIGISCTDSLGQKKRTRLRDFFSFKNKKIEAATGPIENYVDQNIFEIDTVYIDSLAHIEAFNLYRELNLVEEDTTSIPLYFNVPVQVSEQLFIDSVWVTLREYYSIWDSKKSILIKLMGKNSMTLYAFHFITRIRTYHGVFQFRPE